jgi:cell fate regulator YaaT (PSP1 superfamily)
LTEVVSIKFNSHGKSYYFDPNGVEVRQGDKVIVETAKGLDIGECAVSAHYVTDESIIPPLRPVIRTATEEDLQIAAQNKEREKEAFEICKDKIAAHGLDMKLVDVECGFEGNKILFFFTADGRVDFRDLVKDLAAVFRTRIELRQIGVRDETKMLGGLGICGRPYCCNQFLNDFQPVSTKMAKTQSMSLNPTKISGSCGRLMCCLRYEQDAYEDLLKNIPKNGAFVQTAHGYGNVVQTNVLRQKVKVRIDDDGEDEIKVFDVSEVATVPGGRPKPGDPVPYVLNSIEKEAEETEPEEDPWEAPSLFAEESGVRSQKKDKGEEDIRPDSEALKPEVRKREPNRLKIQHNSGKNRSQSNDKSEAKHGNLLAAQVIKPKDIRTHNSPKQQQNGDTPNKAKEKQPNQNKNKKRYYKPKPKKDNQTK